jgi:hypothetical protein
MKLPGVLKAAGMRIVKRLKGHSEPLPLQKPESGRLIRVPSPHRSPLLQQVSLTDSPGNWSDVLPRVRSIAN